LALYRQGNLGSRRQVSEAGVGDDHFDGLGVACGFGVAREIEAGDLEPVEEKAGTFGVDLVSGDAAEDLADGALDGAAVFREGKVEAWPARAPSTRMVDGPAGGVMVVAKFFATQAWAAAASAGGEDVAALKAFGYV
jgi:hypothetical protein